MVKAEVKTPNKRKSFGNDTPAKKPKVENGKNNEKTPKKQLQTPKNKQAAKKNQQNQGDSDSPKKIKPFTGTKQLEGKKPNKQKQPQNEEASPKTDKKKKRKNPFHSLIVNVKEKPGSKDPQVLKSLNEKINEIQSRGELSKTAKKKLSILQKLKLICEEGSEAAAAKSQAKVQAEKAGKGKTEKKPAQQQQVAQGKKKKAAVKAPPAKVEEDDDEGSDEEESEEEQSGEEEEDDSGEEDSDAEAEGNDEEESDDEEGDDDEEEDDDDSDEEVPAPQGKPPVKKSKSTTRDEVKSKFKKEVDIGKKTKIKNEVDIGEKPKIKKEVDVDELQNNELVTKGQKRFVLFVGNIPYDTTRQDLVSHFSKAGDIVHVRLPTDKGSNRPRGFGYIEVKDEITYQKCLSMHHSQIKGRRINVLYTQSGKKKGEDRKKEIKLKNMKLHGLRAQGKLAGSVKQNQKRSFRRNKKKTMQVKSEKD